MKRSLLLPLLLVAPFLPVEQTQAASSGITVSTVSHGIKLTLIVRRRTYPRNALVKLPIIVQNESRRPILTSMGPQCMGANPSVEVLNGQGQVMPQLPSITYDGPGCKAPQGQPFLPGKVERLPILAFLSGSYVRVVLQVGQNLNRRIASTPARARLVPGVPPVATIHQSNIGPYVTVPRPRGAKGPLYFVSSALCGSPTDPTGRSSSFTWTSTLYGRVYSGCYGAQDWHGFAGYLNYPVASIDYTAAS